MNFAKHAALAGAVAALAACGGAADDSAADGATTAQGAPADPELVAAAEQGEMEKCYGVAKAGENDCAAGPRHQLRGHTRPSTGRAMPGNMSRPATASRWAAR